MSKYPTISDNPVIQERYVACRRAGSSHRVSEMLAFRAGPSLQTDTRWLAGLDNGRQFVGDAKSEEVGSYYKQVAQAHGVDTTGAVYKSQLARFPGDPKAWVRSKADVVAVAKERGMTLEGGVSYKPPPGPDPPEFTPSDYRVADDIVDREYKVLCDHEPEAAKMPAATVKEQIREKLSPASE